MIMSEPFFASTRHPESSSDAPTLLERAHSRSLSKSEKFLKSLSIPLNVSNAADSTTSSPTGSTSSKNRIGSRSNSITGILSKDDISLGEKIKRKLSARSSSVSNGTGSGSSSNRSRSNSLKQPQDATSSNHSPIFNTGCFSDITDDYFKYQTKKRNRSNASSTFSSLVHGSPADPMDNSSQGFEENESVYSTYSISQELTLSQLQQRNESESGIEIFEEDDIDDDEDIAESMAFNILEKIKEIS